MMLRSNWLFPLALAVILGGLSAWLERISTIHTETVRLNPKLPQYEMTGMAGRRFDEQGKLHEKLDAQRAWQLPDGKDVFLQGADLQALDADGQHYSVYSELARYHLASKQIDFEQGVLLRRHHRQAEDTEIRTDTLTVDTIARTARTDALVHFRQGRSEGSALGMFYDHNSGKLDLPAQVKALIYDPKYEE